MAFCPTCNGTFPAGKYCPKDGTLLVRQEGDTGVAAPADQDPMVGHIVAGRFRVVRLLGKGGMGTVYEAEHTFIKKRVALKMLRPEITSNPEAVERFRREALATSTIGHDNIVTIDDFGILDDGQVYLTMEFLPGAPLNNVLQAEVLPVPRVLDLILQSCHGLAAAHELNIVHRDMKPENVFLVEKGTKVKILDFGIAKVTGAGENTNLTKTGAIFGTPNYMAPEQALGKKVDHRADIYAVGIMLYEMLTGRVPFQSESFLAVLTQHVTETPLPPSEVAPDRNVDAELEALVMKAIAKKPDDRYADMAAMILDLERAIARLAAQPVPAFNMSIPPTVVPGAMAVAPSTPTMQPTNSTEAAAATVASAEFHAEVVAQPTEAAVMVAPVMETAAGGVTATAGELISELEQPPKNRAGLVLAGVAAVLLLVGGGVLAYSMFTDSGDGSNGPLAVAPGETPEPGEEARPPIEPTPVEPPAEVTPEKKPAPAVNKPRSKPKSVTTKPKPRPKSVTTKPKPVEPKPKPGPTGDQPPPLPAPAGKVWNQIISTPKGCDIMDEAKRIGKTPARLPVPRGQSFDLTLRCSGYKDKIVTLIGDSDRVIRVTLEKLSTPTAADDHGTDAKSTTDKTPLTRAERLKLNAAKRKARQEAKAKARKAAKAKAAEGDDEVLDPYAD